MKRPALALCLVFCFAAILSSCSALSSMGLDKDAEYTHTDPETGTEVVTTVGEVVADQVDDAGAIVSNIAGKALGVATGNPVVGVSVSALLAALIGSGSSRLRRKKAATPLVGGSE